MAEKLENGALSDALGVSYPSIGQSPNFNMESIGYNVTGALLTLNPWYLNLVYKCYGFIQTAINIPVEDAFRGGVDIETSDISPEELELLKQTMEDNNGS